jgi:chaperonin cofactor prefoldin
LNCVTNGNLVIPFKVRDFVSELFSSFQQLNLRNDLLRKRYDSIKYELQKVESVIYDIKIRNLAPAQ